MKISIPKLTPSLQTWTIRGIIALLIVLVFVFIDRRQAEEKAIIAAATTLPKDPSDIQKDSIRQIVRQFRRYGDGDKRKLAYILATARYEASFEPKPERRCSTSQACYYAQEKYWYTGFFGRGLVQLTHQSNYMEMGQFLGIDLVNYPDKALETKNAAKILVFGMLNGNFGHRLDQHINDTKTDYVNARRSVNGTDKANLFAQTAIQIETHL
jgi:hypothetical protein